ncbi:MAG TPA: AzlC family ABC transporter permease [Acidimicrobiia bacterium]|nr:AzlC family ABC transporter permease [Acidimicrobiia bacterium]
MLTDVDLRRGVKDTLPILVPVVPFALVLGLSIAESAMPNWVGWLGASAIFGGAAQLTVVTLTAEGAALLAVVAAGLVVQARHLMYSAALAPVFGQQPRWFRWLGPYFLIDQLFALTSFRVDDSPVSFRRYYLGSAVTFWLVWQVTVAAGLFVGPVVPESWSLGFAVPLLFVGLMIGALDSRPAVAAAVASTVVTWLTLGLPNRAGIMLGAAAGVVAGLVANR